LGEKEGEGKGVLLSRQRGGRLSGERFCRPSRKKGGGRKEVPPTSLKRERLVFFPAAVQSLKGQGNDLRIGGKKERNKCPSELFLKAEQVPS